MDTRAWAMNPVPKAPGQKRSGAAGASIERLRLPDDRRVHNGASGHGVRATSS